MTDLALVALALAGLTASVSAFGTTHHAAHSVEARDAEHCVVTYPTYVLDRQVLPAGEYCVPV